MSYPMFRSSFLRAAAVSLAMLLAPVGALAEDNDNNVGTVNCGDQNTKDACIECCTTITCLGKISCCPLVGTCSVVNKPSSTALPPLKLAALVGGLKLQLQRKGEEGAVDIKLKAGFLKKVFPKGVMLEAQLTGTDARIAGLLFPIAFLGLGDGAISMLNAQGFDVSVAMPTGLPTCQSLYPAQVCTDLAYGLAKSIHGAISVGSRDEQEAFLNGAYAIGFPTCPVFL